MSNVTPVYVCDIDGTIANIDHRLKYVEGNRKDWKTFNEKIPEDSPNQGVIDTVNAWYDAGYTVVLASGRTDDCREITVEWMDRHGVSYHHLFMRKAGDYRKDSIIKEEILYQMRDEFDMWPEFVLDDRPEVVQMWRDNGIMVGQVADWRPAPMRGKYPPQLHILIGPSGAGKSHWIASNRYLCDRVVSSDNIRALLTGDMLDQSMNNRVFKALHHVVKERLHVGLSTYVDATNIRRADRVAIKKLAPEGTRVVYHVFNRPMEDKVRDGGWRLTVPELLERHENTFQQNLKYIMKGDSDPSVEIYDHREDV